MNNFRNWPLTCVAYLLMASLLLGQQSSASVMTFNIRLDVKSDSLDNWHLRKADMVQLLRHYHPDVLGLQEVLHHQLTYLDSSLVNYTFVGVARDDGATKGEYSPVFYDSTKFDMVLSSTFWLSQTPDIPSRGWDAALPRVCTYVLLKHKQSEKLLWVFNTHFDHIGQLARENSARLILEKINQLNVSKCDVVLMGDFNSTPDNATVKILADKLNDARYTTVATFYGPEYTFNGFGKEPGSKRIDYVFTAGMDVLEAIHIDDRKPDGRYVSDHFPVMARLQHK